MHDDGDISFNTLLIKIIQVRPVDIKFLNQRLELETMQVRRIEGVIDISPV